MACGSMIGLFSLLILLPLIGGAIIGIILILISIIMFIVKIIEKKKTGMKVSYLTLIVLFLIGCILSLPLGITVLKGIYEEKKVANLKNVIWLDERYWENGFEYNDKKLVKFNKLYFGEKLHKLKYENVANIRFSGLTKYKPVYKLNNEIPYDIFFVKDNDNYIVYMYEEDIEKFWEYYLDNAKTETKVIKNGKEYNIDFSFRKYDEIINHGNVDFIKINQLDINEEDVYRIIIYSVDCLFEELIDVVYNTEDGKYYVLNGGYHSDWFNNGYMLCDSCTNYIEQQLELIMGSSKTDG